MASNGNGLKTSIPRDEFMRLPQKEQNFLIYGAVAGHERRIDALEEKTSNWWHQSKAIVGGIVGAIIFLCGKLALAIIGK